jgi:hypothetical protein
MVEHAEQTQTPQFLQWLARRNIANLPLQIQQTGLSVNGNIFGGAFAMADSRASFSEVKENAFRYFEAVAGFLATPFWLVLIVAIHKFVAVL